MEPYHPPRYFLFYLVLLFFTGCIAPVERNVNRSYYFWRNTTQMEPEEKSFLRQHHINRLYYKILDVTWSETERAYPVSINYAEAFAANIHPSDSLPLDIVPVVFITNTVFRQIDSAEIPELAIKVLRKCYRRYDAIDSLAEADWEFFKASRDRSYYPGEIQIDCDWTAGTARKYFYFLDCIQESIRDRHTLLSATIRLHQYKYPEKTGVPPVDKGMLMVYNISDATRYDTVNSIFDKEKAGRYFTRKKPYALPLDIALAAYSWGIVYRDKKFYLAENRLQEEDIRKHPFFKPVGANRYAVTTDTVYKNLFLRTGDEIKLEKIDEPGLMDAARLAVKAVNNDILSVSLFELSADEIKNYRYETIEQVYDHFQ